MKYISKWININSLMQTTSPVVVALTGGSDAETDAQAQNTSNAGEETDPSLTLLAVEENHRWNVKEDFH